MMLVPSVDAQSSGHVQQAQGTPGAMRMPGILAMHTEHWYYHSALSSEKVSYHHSIRWKVNKCVDICSNMACETGRSMPAYLSFYGTSINHPC